MTVGRTNLELADATAAIALRQELASRDGKMGYPFPSKDEYFFGPKSGPVAGSKDASAHGVQSRLRHESLRR